MKGIILCGGKGKEMMPISAKTPKSNIILQGIPIVQHIINGLQTTGITEIIVVVSDSGEPIVKYLKKIDSNLKFTIINQMSPGVEGAILSVKDEIKDSHFFLAHGDIIAPSRFYKQLMRTFKSGGDGAIAITLKSSISDFGVIQLDNTGYVSEVIEHPGEDKTDIGNYIGAGAYIFPKSFFKHIKSDSKNSFDKAINELIRSGIIINASIFSEESLWMDLGNPYDLITANRILFSQYFETRISKLANISPSAQIEGPVVIESGVKIEHGAVIKGPVYIGKNVYIGTNSLIRDYTSIEEGCTIGYCVEITRSHFQPYSNIGRLSFVGDSIVGDHTSIKSGVTIINELPDDTYLDIRGSIFNKAGVIIGPDIKIGANGVLEPVSVIEKNTLPGTVIKDQKHKKINQILKTRK
ncbi:MAG: Bifunctional protein GlmU [Candidatus Heimdallarchaeota archaeon LC_3]|nr:MAG: Bifunctional protein GlmU [Candidatus Heimdallarchaeota archaeon LC_3]